MTDPPAMAVPPTQHTRRPPADPDRVHHSLSTILDARTHVEPTTDGLRVSPGSVEACARIMTVASASKWTVAPTSACRWSEPADADIILAAAGLASDPEIRPKDLVATVGAGTEIGDLQRQLGSHGMWLPIDPPGGARSVGSVLATATAGPLRAGYGSIRDHVLGITMVSGDGRVLRVGGRVVKNVAGFDLTRLAVGSFGAYGLITSAHLRLRAHPESDVTLVMTGSLEALYAEAGSILATGLAPAALELTSETGSPDRWTLALRLVGSTTTVQSLEQIARDACSTRPDVQEPADDWRRWSEAVSAAPVTIRIGAPRTRLLDAVTQCREIVGPGLFSVNGAGPQIRWAGDTDAARIGDLRSRLASNAIPVTVERAPRETLRRVGHFGAYRAGVSTILGHIRTVFDPHRILAVPLEGPS